MLISSKKAFIDTPRIVFNQTFGHPVAQPDYDIKLAIMRCIWGMVGKQVHSMVKKKKKSKNQQRVKESGINISLFG